MGMVLIRMMGGPVAMARLSAADLMAGADAAALPWDSGSLSRRFTEACAPP